ncbi:hypothetical protein PUNSTDRAFT_131579 [Punctularia strigosozonata HHB-11173 SS5]|uniref:uncharacterized protein n=1 Tax=Punctularia strigosozonata (strain HHB-11173) TaxID=741275 RepID=UPI00044186C5|nr:uncharacterized protein PUNSTDRAFT_131579 [Punctularia strigosozonata HHB-11173 SS5]EIN11414.1 hypothetical protein PUNSTDRAFT_131579 [Punctularia strigosozonata HHB-11173 SS5]
MASTFSPFINGKFMGGKGADYGYASGSYLRHYPGTLFLCLAWIAYTLAMLWLLNDTSQMSSPERIFAFRKERIAEHMTVIFSQGHTGITAAHLARLAISALQNPSTAPRTWTELFWIADGSWQNPIGMGQAYLTMARKRVKPSATFVLFSMACALALATPSVITRAWPSGTIDTRVTRQARVETLTPESFNNVGSVAQMATGEGSWTSGLSVFDIYNSSVFTRGQNSSVPTNRTLDDIFFGGDPHGMNISSMAGVWLRGGCEVLQSVSVPYPGDLHNSSNTATWQWCQDLGMYGSWNDRTIWSAKELPDIDLTVNWCSDWAANSTYNTDWMNQPPFSDASVIAQVHSHSTDGSEDVTGYIKCNASFATGAADVDGQRQTFSQFEQSGYFDTSVWRDEIPWHPLVIAFSVLTQELPPDNDGNWIRYDSTLQMLGYKARLHEGGETNITATDAEGGDGIDEDGAILHSQITLETMSSQMWVGATHMTATLATLSRNETFAQAVQLVPISGRNRNLDFVYLAVAMLGSWLLILVYCTIRMHRLTFSGSLNAYSAGRLLVDWPELVEEHCCGDLAENGNLQTPFGRVEDTRPEEEVGHIGVTHTGGGKIHKLTKRRAYR